MSIVLALPSDIEIENYDGLQAFLIDHLQLDSATAAQLPTFIRLAEYRLNRLVLAPERETTVTVSTTAGQQTTPLPTGFRQARQLKVTGSEGYPLEPVTLNVVETMDYQGKPTSYWIGNGAIYLGPVPDAVYSLRLSYLAKLPPLTSNSQTNWLLSENADAYVYMTGAVVEKHLGNNDSAALFLSMAETVVAELNAQGNRFRNSAPMRLQSPVVV